MRPPPAALPPWRVFLPLAAVWGAAVIALTVAGRQGLWTPPEPWSLARWHAHEMVWGHVPAGFAGVLLTALPRWTGRPPPSPATVLALAGCWLAARAAALVDGAGGALLASPLFAAGLAGVAGVATIRSGDRRDLPLVALLAVLALADLGTVAGGDGLADVSLRVGLSAMVAIAAVMGGRVAPALTRHLALTRGLDLHLAAPRGLERAVAAATVAALAVWASGATGIGAAIAPAAAALLHLVRLARWRGWTALRRPSILALHLGYAGLPIGFALLAAEAAGADLRFADAGIHAIGVGLLGAMCFAVQASVARRHAGRALTRDLAADLGCAALLGAAIARLALASDPGSDLAAQVAGAGWILAEALLLGLALRPATRTGTGSDAAALAAVPPPS